MLRVFAVKMQAVSSIGLIVACWWLVTSCQTGKTPAPVQDDIHGGQVDMVRETSVDGERSYLTAHFYFLEDSSRLASALRINGVVMLADSSTVTYRVAPGNYDILGAYIGQKWIKIDDLVVQEGDSVVMKLYFETDPRPLEDISFP